jgi:hypothetical protein
MKYLAKLFVIWTIATTPLLAFAQNVVSTINDLPWSLRPGQGMVQYNNAVIAVGKLGEYQHMVTCLTKDMKTAWTDTINSEPLTMHIFHDKLLLITQQDVRVKGVITLSNTYTGYIIAPKTGQILLKKVLYGSSEMYYKQVIFLFAPDGDDLKMVLRTSTEEKESHKTIFTGKKKKASLYYDTKNLQVLEFNDSLKAKSTINPHAEPGWLIGATTNKDHDLFLAFTDSNKMMRIARYTNGEVSPAKVLQLGLNQGDMTLDNITGSSILFTSKTNPSVLYHATIYNNTTNKRELVAAKFNFDDSSISHNTQVIDNHYLKNLQDGYVPFSAEFSKKSKLGTDAPHQMVIDNYGVADGKLVLTLTSYDLTYDSDNSTETYTDTYNVLINIYDDQMNLAYQPIIPREFNPEDMALTGVGMHFKNNKLYVVCNDNKNAFLGQINMADGKITGLSKISIPEKKRGNQPFIYPEATIWFEDQFILNYVRGKGFLPKYPNYITSLQLVNY